MKREYKLSLLRPERCLAWWSDLAPRIQAALPEPVEPEQLNALLPKLVAGTAQCWLWLRRRGKKTDIRGIVLSEILKPTFSSPLLWILTYRLYDRPTAEQFEDAMAMLNKLAHACHCDGVVAVSDNRPDLADAAEMLGVDAHCHVIQFPLSMEAIR